MLSSFFIHSRFTEVENPWESQGNPKGKANGAEATVYAVCDVK